jgi:peptide deformylase|uniref:Peptide deformylase n=1 Tax=Desulfobacca acetoxidans TaxID=60893 RepID=A0A7V6A6G9_9BACT
MKIRPICTFPDQVLKTRAEEVTDINGDLQTLIDDMGATMYAAPGLGLAANQVGDLRRVIVFDVSSKEGPRDLQVIVNPCITECEGELVHNEGCLSVLDFSADVRRHSRVYVTGVDRHGKPIEVEAEGLKAVVLQHEIDHLNGILFIDRISSLKRGLYLRKLKKQAAAR